MCILLFGTILQALILRECGGDKSKHMQFDHMFIRKNFLIRSFKRLRQLTDIYTFTQRRKIFVSGKRNLKLKSDEMFGRFQKLTLRSEMKQKERKKIAKMFSESSQVYIDLLRFLSLPS